MSTYIQIDKYTTILSVFILYNLYLLLLPIGDLKNECLLLVTMIESFLMVLLCTNVDIGFLIIAIICHMSGTVKF